MAKGPGPGEGAGEPAVPSPAQPPATAETRQPSPEERLLAQVNFARSESLGVMAAIDADTENVRNLLYRLAQANVTLCTVMAELLRPPAAGDTRPDV